MNVDEILELLACDWGRYANVSKNTLVFPCYVSSQDEVLSLKVDVESDTKSEYYVLSFGGV